MAEEYVRIIAYEHSFSFLVYWSRARVLTYVCRGLQANMIVVHDPDYRVALDDFTKFLEVLSEKVSEVDETVPELPVKDIVSPAAEPYYGEKSSDSLNPDLSHLPR